MTRSPGSRWYVVHTHSHAEGRAASHLERQGFCTYLPRYPKRRRHARRVETVAAVLFPRYLFVDVDIAARSVACIRSTIGVASVVSCGTEPAAVGDEIIDELKNREDENGFVRLVKPRVSRGERVCVVHGALSNCLGLVEGMTEHERVSVLLDLLGRRVRVALELDAIAPA